MNPLSSFNNYELKQLLTYGLLYFTFTLFPSWHSLLSLIMLKQVSLIISFLPQRGQRVSPKKYVLKLHRFRTSI